MLSKRSRGTEAAQRAAHAAAEGALSDGTVGYTPEERRLIASFIEPEEEGPREFMLRVRLSDAERGTLERLATAAGLNMSEYVRQTVLGECGEGTAE